MWLLSDDNHLTRLSVCCPPPRESAQRCVCSSSANCSQAAIQASYKHLPGGAARLVLCHLTIEASLGWETKYEEMLRNMRLNGRIAQKGEDQQ